MRGFLSESIFTATLAGTEWKPLSRVPAIVQLWNPFGSWNLCIANKGPGCCQPHALTVSASFQPLLPGPQSLLGTENTEFAWQHHGRKKCIACPPVNCFPVMMSTFKWAILIECFIYAGFQRREKLLPIVLRRSSHWLMWGNFRISFHFLLLPLRFPPPPAEREISGLDCFGGTVPPRVYLPSHSSYGYH